LWVNSSTRRYASLREIPCRSESVRAASRVG
jgi:hypothetical protein